MFRYISPLVVLATSAFAVVKHGHVNVGNVDTGRFLITLKDEANMDFHRAFVQQLTTIDELHYNDVHQSAFTPFSFIDADGLDVYGYSAKLDLAALTILSRSTDISLIERDLPVHIQDHSENLQFQHNAPWGLVRASHRKMLSDHDFIYEENDGNGVDVYVIDTGVYTEHNDFGKRATFGKSFIKDRNGQEIRKDDNGHGTHCAGTIAGNRYGMCKNCNIIAVKVLAGDGSGSMSGVISGVDWAVKQSKNTNRTSIISMSLGGGRSITLNRAVDGAVSSGVHVAVASGNSGDNSCDYSPASAENVISVGAINSVDRMAYFSNYGECTHVFAPGVRIESTWIHGKNSTAVLDGTSMATPHVAGALGELLSRDQYKGKSPKEMRRILQELSTKDLIIGIPSDYDTINSILYNGVSEDGSGKQANVIFFEQLNKLKSFLSKRR